eukprot:12879920-Prorocentrum_lima.AAC.1
MGGFGACIDHPQTTRAKSGGLVPACSPPDHAMKGNVSCQCAVCSHGWGAADCGCRATSAATATEITL